MSHYLFELIVVIIYFAVLILISVYGIHRYVMVHLFRKYRSQHPEVVKQFE